MLLARFLRRQASRRLPDHVRKLIKRGSEEFKEISATLRSHDLTTVCEEAKCPNIGECWGEHRTATIMVMGNECTRACGFCAVKTASCPPDLDPEEPFKIAEAVTDWNLRYVVLTTVSRDDLPDQGASHLVRVVEAIKEKNSEILVELLCNDFQGREDLISSVVNSGLEVFSHNIEVVQRLSDRVRDHRASYLQSLGVLRTAAEVRDSDAILTKSSLMFGLGETDDEIMWTLEDLRNVDCDVITLGQYLQPSRMHLPVVEYVEPEKFEEWQEIAESMGFLYVASGPLVRSSYKAGEHYLTSLIQEQAD